VIVERIGNFLAALIILTSSSYPGFAQDKAQRRSSIQSIRMILDPQYKPSSDTKPIKSGTPLIALSHQHWNQLSMQSKNVINQAFQVIATQTSRLSPSGKFRIHYDTTGANTPALLDPVQHSPIPNTYEAYVDSVAAIFDYCWRFQIDSLGYRPPAPHIAEDGKTEYDVYIQDLDPSLFGFTAYDESMRINPGSEPARYWTYTVVDNDYLGYRTNGMDGLRATAAHEFQHAIHLGGYGMWSSLDIYFFELTAGWMEGVTFPTVHDYYYDVSEYFTSFRDVDGSLPFYHFDSRFIGSERGIWGQFMSQRFGRDVIRDIWERELNEPILTSINDALLSRGTDFESEFALFSYWNYFTADRADTVRYYLEGWHYPRFVSNSTAPLLIGGTASVSGQAYVFSSSFFDFPLATDTLTAIITNVDLPAAEQYDSSTRTLQLVMGASVSGLPAQMLPNGLRIGFDASDRNKWIERYLMASSKSDVQKIATDAAPNPMHLSQVPRLALPMNEPLSSWAEIYFLNSALSLDYSGSYSVVSSNGGQYVFVPSSDLRSHLSTGVYFVVAQVGSSTYRWKVAVIK
jgi:hypothetical protein